jgi:hypothetical protein
LIACFKQEVFGESIMIRIAISLIVAVAAAGCAAHEGRPQSRNIVVEGPTDLPEMARSGGADIFLHDGNNGKTYLYIEGRTGQTIAVLDVTDPGAIRAVAEVRTAATGPFMYVEDRDPQGGLIQYRAGGLAVMNLSKYDHPTIDQTPQLGRAKSAQSIGVSGLLLTEYETPPGAPRGSVDTYDVLDTAHPGSPTLLATVTGVTRRVTKADTGTVFLLADDGVTVVRDLRAEEARALEISASKQ